MNCFDCNSSGYADSARTKRCPTCNGSCDSDHPFVPVSIGDDDFLLGTEETISQIGQQIEKAESARNHIAHDKLGEHIDILFDALAKLSGCER